MSRRIKLDFKPLTLSETAKALGIPRARARKILAIVGVDFNGHPAETHARGRLARAKRPPLGRTSPVEDRSAVANFHRLRNLVTPKSP